MGKRFFNLILLLILIALIAGILFGGKIIYQEFFEEFPEQVTYQVDKIFTEEPDVEKNTSIETNSASIGELFQNSSNINGNESPKVLENSNNSEFFYKQLNTTQKKIYDGLMQNKKYLKQGNYTIQFDNSFTDILSQEGGADILGDDYQAAIEAFTHDNIDIFW